MSTIAIIPIKSRIQDSLELAAEYHAAFEYNDFFSPEVLDQPGLIHELLDFYLGLERDRSQDTLHGVFLDITIHSSDSLIRDVSSKRIHQSMDIASKLGIRGVVFHTNIIANFHDSHYINHWLKSNKEFFLRLSLAYPQLQIYMENMFDLTPDQFAAFGSATQDIPNIHLCLDIAHAALSDVPLTDWIARSAPYIHHLHLNDNDGLSDLHNAIGTGSIDWLQFNETIRSYPINPSVLIETSSVEKQRQSLLFMKRNHLYPFP